MPTTYIDIRVSGINDVFSTVAYYVNYYKANNWPIKDIFFSTKMYDNLLNYLDFYEINYVPPTRACIYTGEEEKTNLSKQYDVLYFYEKPKMFNTNLNLNTSYHLSNFIKIKPNIIQESLPFVSNESVHLRFMANENNPTKIEDNIQYYKTNISNLIQNKNRDYTIISSSPFSFLDDLSSMHKNVKYVPKNYIAFKDRKANTKDVFLDLAIMSQSKIIHKTEGYFVETAKMFGKGIPEIYQL